MGIRFIAGRKDAGRKKKAEKNSFKPEKLTALKKKLGGKLKVCLAQNGGVLSFRRHKGGGGIDYIVAKAVADALGVTLKIVWFESENEEESNPVDEVNAFMSYGLCQLAASFPLHRDAIGQGPGRSVPLARYRHMPERDVGRIVNLRQLIVSAPYRSTRFVVVLPGSSTLRVKSLADLDGRKILAEQGTVAGAISMQYQGGLLRDKVDLVKPGPRTLWIMEGGKHDAAVIELDKYDSHRKQNRITKLKLSGYEHSIRYNIGLVSIDRHQNLIAFASAVIKKRLADGSLARAAVKSGVSFRAPDSPLIRGRLSFRELARD